MRLEDALTQVALAVGLPAEDLIRYAAEDNIGGRDTSIHRHPDWSAMSTFADEGKLVYALIRALRPRQVVEIGVASGGTSTHILSALAVNGYGKLWSADIEANCGLDVPQHLTDRWTFVVGDALTIDLPEHADFIFEDGAHSFEFTCDVLRRLKKLNPRVLISHDFFTSKVYGGFFVDKAWAEVLPDGFGIELDGAFTGLGVWANPDYTTPEPVVDLPDWLGASGPIQTLATDAAEDLHEALDEPTPEEKPAAKLKRGRKAAKRG